MADDPNGADPSAPDDTHDALFPLHDEEGVEPSEVERVGRDLVRIPLRTPTLPPATRTNAYLVRSERGWLLVDPASADADAIARLDAAVGHLPGGWSDVVGALLTHEHIDHVGGLGWWATERRTPVWAHPATITALRGPDGLAWRSVDADAGILGLRVLHTPGHARGHLVVRTRASELVAGDLIAGVGTILVDREGGGMGAYLASLREAAALEPARIFPAHGPASETGAERLQAYITHRLRREERVFRGLSQDEARDAWELTGRGYAELPSAMWPLALGSAVAHLDHLVEEGRAERVVGSDGVERWQRASDEAAGGEHVPRA